MEYNIAVIGASGQVGGQVVKELEACDFPVKQLLAFASKDSIGESIEFLGEEIALQELDNSAFDGADIVFFCTPAQVTKEYLPLASQAGAFCIDLSRASLGTSAIPCILAELSSNALLKSLNTVANPPVATIQAALILKPLQIEFGLKQVSLTVLQSASALGKKGVEVLSKQSGALLNGRPLESDTIVAGAPSQLALNITPLNSGNDSYSSAEEIRTTLHRVLDDTDIKLQVEVVQAPVFYANALCIACELESGVDKGALLNLLQEQQGLELQSSAELDNCGTCTAQEYDTVPVCITQMGENGQINLWSVIDNLRKGSALNAVQIAQLYITG